MPETNRPSATHVAEVQRDAPPRTWQRAIREAVRDARELAVLLELPASTLLERIDAQPDFPLLVPRGFVARMRKRDPDDPLLCQVLPSISERIDAGFADDPLAERPLVSAGVVQKYLGRALMITTAACPVHCRYCFRRHFPYSAQLASRNDWRPALERLRSDRDIAEVILSGGDPLSLATPRLAGLIDKLEELEHVQRLRIHTRFPIIVPERVEPELLKLLAATRLKTVIVVHANHPHEIDVQVAAALAELAGTCDALLNQSVLLRGVNDSVDTLCALSERLFDAGALPYYLHLLDKVRGAAHFDVPETEAQHLMRAVRARLPGYLVPSLVRETPGALSKVVVNQ